MRTEMLLGQERMKRLSACRVAVFGLGGVGGYAAERVMHSANPGVFRCVRTIGDAVEAGETDHEALIREIKEEMDWDVYVDRKLGTVEEQYPDFSISLTAYLCKGGNGEFKLLEHLDYKWLTKDELPRLNWTDADRKLLALL